MRLLIFPAAVMTNLFAMMVLTIGLSLFGKPLLAAEIGLVHGATVALFYALSGNARSLILSGSAEQWAARVLRLRLLMLLPLCLLAWLLCAGIVGDSPLFIGLLILRRATEWLAEVFLSEHELHERSGRSLLFAVLQSLGLLAVLAALLADRWVIPVTFLWACSPLCSCISRGLLLRSLASDLPVWQSLRQLLPHFGSTLAIGFSVYVFRLFILLLAGKEQAGDLFAAFALGGILGAVFSQALGPTMIRQEQLCERASGRRLVRVFDGVLVLLLGAGMALGACLWYWPGLLSWTLKSNLFWIAVSCSLVGGVVTVQAQRVRLRLLQGCARRDVFGSDVLANLLLVGCVPLLFFGAGGAYLASLYLVGALLSLTFYLSEDWTDVMSRYQGNRLLRAAQLAIGEQGRYRHWLTMLLMAGLFAPVFVQLGSGLYLGGRQFNSDGNLAMLPIPLAVLACYLGIVLLGGYARARTALVVIFFTFTGMLLSVLLVTGDTAGSERGRLILLVQYALPMFALILGVQFGSAEDALRKSGRVLLVVLLLTVTLQLVATVVFAERHLSSSALIFGVYQHMQYVPVILCAGFLIVLYGLWEQSRCHAWLMLLAMLMGVYATVSVSMLALLLLLGGVAGFVIRSLLLNIHRLRAAVLTLMVLAGVALGFIYMSSSSLVAAKVGFLLSGDEVARQAPPNLSERLVFWRFYLDGVGESWQVLLFGHAQVPARDTYPSAHNYYLDFVYNFGFVALLPLLGLVLFTLCQVLKNLGRVLADPQLMALAGVVLFILLIDNLFKVGMRQPYPGIVSFFLWGVLLAGLSRCSGSRKLQGGELQHS